MYLNYLYEHFFFRLPSTLLVSWPEGYEVTQNESRCAGETVGMYKLLCFVTENVESNATPWIFH